MEEKLTFLKAIHDGLREEMLRDERVFIMGEDVSWNGLGATGGFVEEFGPERVRDTPISEAGFVGAAAGAAMTGMRPVVDMLIAPFMYCAMDQIVSIIAKSTYLYGGQTAMPVTIRAAMFYGNSSAAQHSDRPMATFMTIPGLKIVAPSTPSDAKGLLKAAIREDDPVLYFDDASLWTSIERVEKTEDADVIVPLGKAAIRREGTDVTLVAVSGSNRPALAAADMLADEGISVEVIDPRSLVPLDSEMILASVAKTGRAVLVDPTHRTLSVSSEIASIIAEEGFWSLQAPVIRVTAPSTHVPFSPPLESGLFPNAERIAAAVRKVME
jgi:acetoin:2,6-dichlorophenolindophenol oxidoreductase subunit beta